MKRSLVVILLLSCIIGFSQQGIFSKNPILNKQTFDKRLYHLGFYLGFNDLGFKTDYIQNVRKEIETNSELGFNVGVIGNLRINDFFNLRFEPGFCITQRNLVYPYIEDQVDRNREVKSTYVYFPLLFKYSALRSGNIKPCILAGYSRILNLNSNHDAKDDNYSNRFRMTKWTNAYELGLGIDIYFEYFKFSPSIRGVFSLGDELIRDNDPNSPWTSNVLHMKTRGVFLNFAFH